MVHESELLKSQWESINHSGLDGCHGCYPEVQSHCSLGCRDLLMSGYSVSLCHCSPREVQWPQGTDGSCLIQGNKPWFSVCVCLRTASLSQRAELLGDEVAPPFLLHHPQGTGATSSNWNQLWSTQWSWEDLKSFRKHSGLGKMVQLNYYSWVIGFFQAGIKKFYF